jgi:hypothetical protein
VPRSYINWNFKILDPPQAIFAEEVLTNKNNMEQILNFESESNGRVSELKHESGNSITSSRLNYTKSHTISNLSTRKVNEARVQSVRVKKKDSHPAWYQQSFFCFFSKLKIYFSFYQ